MTDMAARKRDTILQFQIQELVNTRLISRSPLIAALYSDFVRLTDCVKLCNLWLISG